MGLEAPELARWTRFAAKGGIGKCTATCDCVAESADDLMFLKDDEITVLLQLPDQENLFLGYCEGVVGHFSGSDVHFHAKLKVPVKAKRASMVSRMSPTSSDISSPICQPSSPHNSTSKMEAEAPERRSSHQRRFQAQIPSRMQPMEDEPQRPSVTFSSSFTTTDSVVATPTLGYFSSPEIKKSSVHGTPSPQDPHFLIEAPRSKSMPPTRASSPPAISTSHSHISMIPGVHKHNMHMPLPLKLTPESITPLRINKRAPTSPAILPNKTVSPPPFSSLAPDTSYDDSEQSRRHSIKTSDIEVGIGLSLLQDLSNEMDSGSDDGYDQWPKPDQFNRPAGTLDHDSYKAALSRVGYRRDSQNEGTQESTIEGLGYTQSEENCEDKGEEMIVKDMPSQTTSVATTNPSSSIAKASHNPNATLPSSTSPISPSFSQSSISTNERRPSLAPSSSSTSEWEGASDIYDDYRYSRYSLAGKMSRFSSSAGIGGLTGNGPLTPPLPDSNSIGRARTDSNKSRSDSSSVLARSRTNSVNRRPSADFLSASSEMRALGGGSLLSTLPLLPEASETGGELQRSLQQEQPRDVHWKRTTIMKERTISIESAASVYTQNSRLSTLSQDIIAAISSGPNVNDHDPTDNNANPINPRPISLSLSQSDDKSPLLHTTWGTPQTSTTATVNSPLTGSSAEFGSPDLHTPVIGMVAIGGSARAGLAIPFGSTEEGRMKARSDMTAGNSGHGGNGVGAAGGIASALRQMLETERHSSMPEQTQNQQLTRNPSGRKSFKDGLGHRIVVEDEDELPSGILDTSGSTFMSTTTTASPEPTHEGDEEAENDVLEQHLRNRAGVNSGPGDRDSHSASILEPDLMMLRTHLTRLTVANRISSASVLEGASDEFQEGRRSAEVEENEEEQDPEGMEKNPSSPIIPTAPPTSPPPQSSFSSSSPHIPGPPPRLSGASIRMGSPIDVRPPMLALSDIREPGGPLVPGSNKRQSLFLPHPNAPKSPSDVVGSTVIGPDPGVPMYIAAQQLQYPQQQQQQGQQGGWARRPGGPPSMMIPPTRPNVVGVIRMALTTPPRVAMGQGPPGQAGQESAGQRPPLMMPMRGPTIYGRTETDLAGSMGPVPIVFSIDPPHAPNPNPTSSASPPHRIPTSKPTMPFSPPRAPIAKQEQHPPRSMPSGAGAPTVAASVSNGAGEGDVAPAIGLRTAGDVIPRTNFFPKPPGMRPRSRSFSGFNSTNAEAPPPLQRSRDEGKTPSGKDMKRSLTTSASSLPPSSSLSPPPLSGLSKLASRLSPLRPFPLSLPQNGITGGIRRHVSSLQPALKSPTSPLAQSIVLPQVASSLPASPNSLAMGNRPHQLRETASISTFTPPTRPIPIPRPVVSSPTTGSIDSPLPSSTSASQSHGHTTSIPAHSRNDDSSPRPSDADAVSINSDTRSQLVSPSVTRQTSLRTKLSLPNLLRHRSRQEDEPGSADSEMLQVQDMEFELVKPNFSYFQYARGSEDSGILEKELSPIEVRPDAFLRAESPATSMSLGASKRSPPINEPPASSLSGPLSTSTPASRATTDSESSMDAHRNREIKWMSLMSSNPASQARKSKKVKKLIMDGVPSSVRYLVWSYLTDGKARCVQGVYAQLCSRGRVPSSGDIERDIKGCFQDQPHLQGTQGPVLLLLQAYLNMVPDIQYTMGLTLIVGQLLLLAPEEDAFWIFISIMDTHIRPYFSTVTTQMEVDSALFSRALESNDNQVAKKLLVDMGISPPTICQPWFSSLFVGTLPPEYLNRIWDLFLFEGVPFLLRVALCIVACCRRVILESASEETVLKMFRHPPPSLLPPTADAFLSLVCSVKLKDDDVRKQRIKMEAQVKRQTQTPRTISTAGGISLPRT